MNDGMRKAARKARDDLFSSDDLGSMFKAVDDFELTYVCRDCKCHVPQGVHSDDECVVCQVLES